MTHIALYWTSVLLSTMHRQNLRGHRLLLKILKTRTSAYQNFFKIKYLYLWNSHETVPSQSFSLFSSHLYNELLL